MEELSPDFKLFAGEARQANPDMSSEQIISLYEDYQRNTATELPDPNTSSPEEISAFNHSYIETKTNTSFSPEELPQQAAMYIGDQSLGENEFDNEAFNQNLFNEIVGSEELRSVDYEAINVADSIQQFFRLGDYSKVPFGEDPSEYDPGPGTITATDMSLRARIGRNFAEIRRNFDFYIGGTLLGMEEVGALSPALSIADIPFSTYRGAKGFLLDLGVEDSDVPFLSEVSRTMGGLALGSRASFEQRKQELIEQGQGGTAITMNLMNETLQTVSYLKWLKYIGISRGAAAPKAGAVSMFNAKAILSVLGRGQKFGLFAAMTSEGVTMEDRAKIYAIAAMYASTPAVSGSFKNPFVVKTADFMLNTAISAGKEDGYRDIINDPNLTEIEKYMAASSLLGHDIVFSLTTRSWKTGADAQRALAESALRFATELGRPENAQVQVTPGQMFRTVPVSALDARPLTVREELSQFLSKPGGFKILEETSRAYKQEIQKTESTLREELNKIEESVVARPVELDAEALQKEMASDKKPTPKPTIKPTDTIEGKAIDNPTVKKAVTEAMLKATEEANKMDPFDGVVHIESRKALLYEVVDAPTGTRVKTLINRINNVRQGKPAVTFNQKQYYSLLEQVSRTASRSSVKDVGASFNMLSEFARENLPYRQADAVIAKMQKLMESGKKGYTPAEFVDRATAILDRATGRLEAYDAVGKPVDMSARVDLTDAEALRISLKERVEAGRVARRSVIEDIVMSQKRAQEVINEMPKSERGKTIAALRAIAKAQTPETRQKALQAFEGRVESILDAYRVRESRQKLKDFENKARKLIKSKKLTPGSREAFEEILTALEAGRAVDTLASSIRDAAKRGNTEEVAIYGELADFFGRSATKSFKELSSKELEAYADTLNAYLYRVNQIHSQIKAGKKTAAEENKFELIRALDDAKPVDLDSPVRQFFDKPMRTLATIKVRGEMIPLTIARILDNNKPNGPMQRFQERLDFSNADRAEVRNVTQDVVKPFQPRMEELGFNKNKNKKTFEVTDMDGNPIKIQLGVADRSRLYLAYKDPGTWSVSEEVGFVRSFGKRTRFTISQKQYEAIEKYMTLNKETEISDSFIKAYGVLGRYIDKTSMEINGFPLTADIYTGPRVRYGRVDNIDLHKNEINLEKGEGFNEAFVRITAESSGFLKQRTGSDKPLFIYNPATMLTQVAEMGGYYYSRASVLRDLNYTMTELNNSGFKDKYRELGIIRETAYSTWEDYVARLNQNYKPGKVLGVKFDKIPKGVINFAQKYLGKRALSYNTKTPFIQLASLPTAATAIDRKYHGRLYEAFVTDAAPISEMVDKSHYLRARYEGRTGHIYSDKALEKADQAGMQGITVMDGRVIGSIYRVAEDIVRDQKPDLTGEQFNKAVEQEVMRVIFRTQPSFEDTSRPEGAMSTDPLLKMSFIFSSQLNKNYAINVGMAMDVIEMHRRGEASKEDIAAVAMSFGNLAMANLTVATINSTQQEIMEEIFIWRYGDLPNWYEEKSFHEKMMFNYFTAQTAGLGNSSALLASALQGFQVGGLATDPLIKDATQLVTVSKMTYEWSLMNDVGQGDIWWETYGKEYTRRLTQVSNLAVQTTTGKNVANIYKYFVEQPLALFESVVDRDDRAFLKEQREWERELKRWEEEAGVVEQEEFDRVYKKMMRDYEETQK